MRKRSLRYIVPTVILSITLFVLVSQFGSKSNSNILADLISQDHCSMACWIGIEPGSTSKVDARMLLSQNEIPFEDVAGPWEDGGGVFEFPMNTNSGDGIPVLMTFCDNLVNQIVITVDLCLSNMLVEYGEPDEVVVEDSYYYFLYHNLGLFLSTSDEFGLDRISTIFVVNVAPIINLVDRGNSLGWDDFADSLILDC